jgi:hypothetical protein
MALSRSRRAEMRALEGRVGRWRIGDVAARIGATEAVLS